MNSIPPVTINYEIKPEQKPKQLFEVRECDDYYSAKIFAIQHKGVIGQYLDGRYFVVYEVK